MPAKRILVCNAKGGCGKTTLVTNLASYYASRGERVMLFDYDPQASAFHWCQRRDESHSEITVVDAVRREGQHMTRSWHMRVPPGTHRVVIDTPAGIDATQLAAMLQENDFLVIPVLPSPIDMQATAHFIKDLLLVGKARKKQVHIAVVANRVRANTLMYQSLERFLFSLQLPFVTRLRDTQFYMQAFEQGVSILDLRHPQLRQDRELWAPLIRWLDLPLPQKQKAEIKSFNQNRKIS